MDDAIEAQTLVAGGPVTEIQNPSTLKIIGSVPCSTSKDVAHAAARSVVAQAQWNKRGEEERKGILIAVAIKIRGAADELAKALTAEQGKPLKEALIEVNRSADSFQYYGEMDQAHAGGFQLPTGLTGELQRRPIGPCAVLVPWNFPLTLLANKLAPALRSGNAVIIKPAPTTPLVTLQFLDVLVDAGIAPETIQVLLGGAEVGRELVTHPSIRKVSFTGSTETGREIMRLTAASVKRLTLELGGSDPMIVCADADLEQAVRAASIGRYFNAGQACIAIKRVYVHNTLLPEFLTELRKRIESITVGDGFQSGVRMGPLHTSRQRESIDAFVRDAVSKGAHVITGGSFSAAGPGHFYEPTIVTDVSEDALLLSEECFGPVLPVVGFDDVETAIQRANSTKFGLGASIWTEDQTVARYVANNLQAGMIWINQVPIDHDHMPFGGLKESGFGKERGSLALDEYSDFVSISTRSAKS